MLSLPPSLIPGVQLAPACVSWAGTQGFGCLLSLTPSSAPPVQGTFPRRLELRGSTGRRQTSIVMIAGGNMDSPPPQGHNGSHSSKGKGGLAKHVSGQALLQGCHPTALPSNARLGRKPPYQARLSRNCCCFGGLFDYQSQYPGVGTPPLPSTCTMQGPTAHASPGTLHPVSSRPLCFWEGRGNCQVLLARLRALIVAGVSLVSHSTP